MWFSFPEDFELMVISIYPSIRSKRDPPEKITRRAKSTQPTESSWLLLSYMEYSGTRQQESSLFPPTAMHWELYMNLLSWTWLLFQNTHNPSCDICASRAVIGSFVQEQEPTTGLRWLQWSLFSQIEISAGQQIILKMSWDIFLKSTSFSPAISWQGSS